LTLLILLGIVFNIYITKKANAYPRVLLRYLVFLHDILTIFIWGCGIDNMTGPYEKARNSLGEYTKITGKVDELPVQIQGYSLNTATDFESS
jgi:hypothetical protein